MAELSIRLFRDTDSGRLAIRIGFASEEDVLPLEHEQRHRCFLGRLLPALQLDERTEQSVEIQRERPAQEPVVG
jgi:hypothetical protein